MGIVSFQHHAECALVNAISGSEIDEERQRLDHSPEESRRACFALAKPWCGWLTQVSPNIGIQCSPICMWTVMASCSHILSCKSSIKMNRTTLFSFNLGYTAQITLQNKNPHLPCCTDFWPLINHSQVPQQESSLTEGSFLTEVSAPNPGGGEGGRSSHLAMDD